MKPSIKEIVKLLKECETRGVAYLKIDGFEYQSAMSTENRVVTPNPQARGSAKKAKEVTEKGELQMQFDEAVEIASTLQLEDPVAYEAMLAANELEEKNNR